MPTPEETLSVLKSKYDAARALARANHQKLKDMPAQKPLDQQRGLTLRLTKGGIVVARLHYSAEPSRDPDLNPQWKRAERRTYTSQAAWDREQEIVDEAGGGELVFADTLITYWDKIVITDPAWRPDPEWQVEGGFDHGKTNPTACERMYIDFSGALIFCGEYYQPGKLIWQHAKELKKMKDFERLETVHADPSMFNMTNQQSSDQRPGHSQERAKSFGELYREEGIENLFSFAGTDKSDVSFAERVHKHWADLDNREPTLRIACRNYTEGFLPGLHQWDCPNLLWELMTARRVKLTAQQLLTRNISEAIVDKDNHARDAAKYAVMSHPEPTMKSLERRVSERVAAAQEESDATMAASQMQKILREERKVSQPEVYARSAGVRRHIEQLRRRRGR
jgi:hypothetical protein